MAGLNQDNRTGKYIVTFRLNGKAYHRSTDTTDKDKATDRQRQVTERERLFKQNRYPLPDGVDPVEWVWTGNGRPQVVNGGSVGDLIGKYLEQRRLKVEAGQLALSSYASDKYRLDAFRDYAKGRTRLAEVFSPEFLGAYRDHLLKEMGKGRLSAVSVKHSLRTVKAMVLWAFDEELIPTLPRTVRKYADIRLPAPRPEVYTADEVKTLYTAASPRLRLYVLLGLNCGYTQSDIATLAYDMIDWESGVITRKRHKTEVESEHKLWGVTLRLLREQANPKDTEFLLTSEHGNPLVRERIDANGKPLKTDSIGHAFSQVKAKLGWKDRRTFKHLRKTGADMLAKQFQDQPHLVDLYLAHTQKAMRRHYARRHFDALHKATDWLEATLRLE